MQQLQPSTLLQGGKYKIEKVLGQGGFGITYLAIQTGLERKVAIKEFFMSEVCERDINSSYVMLGTSGSKELVNKFRAKFIKEAKNIAKLNHPHIVRVIDIFEENGTAYYVMEYAEGGSLDSKLKQQGYMSEPVALRYIRQVATAVDYIHQRKLNHLDIKPANIMLNEKDEALLIDFGLSKQYDMVSGNQTSSTPLGISEGYAPLEQYRQGGVNEFSPETDIYALGATLFKLLTGKTPPSASDINEDGVPVDMLKAKGVSSAIIETICKSMEGRKKMRTSTITAFIAGLNSNPQSVEREIPRKSKNESTVILEDTQGKEKTAKLQKNQNDEDVSNGMKKVLLIAFVAIISFVVIVVAVSKCQNNNTIDYTSGQTTDTAHVIDNNVSTGATEPTTTDENINRNNDGYGNNSNVKQDNNTKYFRIVKNVFVREGPGTSYATMYSPYCDFDSNNTNGVVVYKGTIVEYLGEKENGFMKVRQTSNNNDRDNWGEGWISSKYLEEW